MSLNVCSNRNCIIQIVRSIDSRPGWNTAKLDTHIVFMPAYLLFFKLLHVPILIQIPIIYINDIRFSSIRSLI